MATSLTTYAPFDAGAGANVTEDTWRSFMKYMLDSGPIANVLNEFQLYADSSGMQVKVRSGECWIQGHWGQKSSETTLAISANATGSTRIDRAVLRAHFGNNVIELDIVNGTASAPALTQNTTMWEISLGQISVANGAVTIAAGNITDERRLIGYVRDHPRAQYRAASAQSIPDAVFTSATFGSEDHDPYSAHSTVTNPSRFTAPFDGTYEFTGAIGFDANSTGARGSRWAKNGSEINGSQILVGNAGALVATIVPARTIQVTLVTGDYVELQPFQSSGGALNTAVTTSQQPTMSVKYTGANPS
jgi:hypothetical protein